MRELSGSRQLHVFSLQAGPLLQCLLSGQSTSRAHRNSNIDFSFPPRKGTGMFTGDPAGNAKYLMLLSR